MKKTPLLLSFFCLIASVVSTNAAAIITLTFTSDSHTLRDNLGAILSGGTTADGDGDVVQIGYFSAASVSNNFAGTWIPLTGQGSLNTGGVIDGSSPAEAYNKTSIGDTFSGGNNASDGQFAVSLTLTVGDATTGNSFPSSTSVPLALRFYNGKTIATSTFYNTVSSDGWLWTTPLEPPSIAAVNMDMDSGVMEWEGGAASADKTTITVPTPEPTSAFLAVVGGIAMLVSRRPRRA